MDGTLPSFSVQQDKVQHEPGIKKDFNTMHRRQQNTEMYKVWQFNIQRMSGSSSSITYAKNESIICGFLLE